MDMENGIKKLSPTFLSVLRAIQTTESIMSETIAVEVVEEFGKDKACVAF